MPRPLRYAAVAAALLVFTNGPVFFAARNLTADSGGWEGDLIRPAIIAAALLAAVTAALDLTWKNSAGRGPAGLIQPHGPAAAAIAVYTLTAIASAAWSVAPGLTLWRSLAYAGLVLLAWVIADMGTEARVPLGLMAAAAVGASLLALAAAPNQAFDIRGYWRGVYITRNSLAPLAALGLLVGIRYLLARPSAAEVPDQPADAKKPDEEPTTTPPAHAEMSDEELTATRPARAEWAVEGYPSGRFQRTDAKEPDRPVRWVSWRWRSSYWRAQAAGAALGVVSLAVLIGAGSRTAWLALVGALAVSALGRAYPSMRRRFGARAAIGAVVGAAASGVAGLATVTAVLWQEPTFAERREIWGLVWDRIVDRPLAGHGFFAFWDVPELTAAHELLLLGSAHNSALEVLLGTGLIGLAPFAVIAAAAALNAGRDLVRNPGADTWLWAAVVAFALFENASESFVLWFSYNWVIVMAAALRAPEPRRLPLRLSRRPGQGSDAKTQTPV